jgi:ribosome-binding factor A
MSRRTERLASTLRQELADIIRREIDDPRVKFMPTITRVVVTEDLSMADVYVTVMGSAGQQTAALNALKHSAGLMRSRLAKMLTIRQMPFLRFQFDESARKEVEMLELLHRLEVEREEHEKSQAGNSSSNADSSAAGADDRVQTDTADATSQNAAGDSTENPAGTETSAGPDGSNP